MDESVRLAVLIPVFNDGRGLHASLASLRAARRPPGTLILVVDDGSQPPITDSEPDGAMPVRLLRLPVNQGIERALNAGLAEAQRLGAAFIARLDAGDTIEADRLELQLRLLEEQPELGLVGSSARFVDETGQVLFTFQAPQSDAEIRARMHVNCCILHPTVMLRTSVLALAGAYSTDYPAAEDYELFFRMLGHCRGACLPQVLVTTTAARDGISLRRRRRQLLTRLRVQRRFFDARRAESYLGILATLLLLVLPQALVLRLKSLAGASRY